MSNSQKWLLIGWMILLTLGIVGLAFYSFKETTLLKNSLAEEIQGVREEVKKLGDEIQHVKEIIKSERESLTKIPGWKSYQNEKYEYSINFPKEGVLKTYREEAYVEILLPDPSRYVGIEIIPTPCEHSPEATTKYINGIKFYVTGTGEGEGAAGSMYYVTHYSATRDDKCVELTTFLRTSSATPIKIVIEKEEVLEQIISTFKFVP